MGFFLFFLFFNCGLTFTQSHDDNIFYCYVWLLVIKLHRIYIYGVRCGNAHHLCLLWAMSGLFSTGHIPVVCMNTFLRYLLKCLLLTKESAIMSESHSVELNWKFDIKSSFNMLYNTRPTHRRNSIYCDYLQIKINSI